MHTCSIHPIRLLARPVWPRPACRMLLAVVLVVALASCARPPVQAPLLPPRPDNVSDIRDVLVLPQDPTAYLDPATAGLPLIGQDAQVRQYGEFLRRWFKPWDRVSPSVPLSDIAQSFETVRKGKFFGENLRPRDPVWLAGLEANASLGTYPNMSRRAVTVARSDFRLLPTDRPVFKDPTLPGEGYPFDTIQNSSIWPATPLFVSHVSRDGAWIYAEGPAASGWLPVVDIAWADDGFVAAFRTGSYATPLRDGLPLADADGVYRQTGRIGMVLPVEIGNGSIAVANTVATATAGARLPAQAQAGSGPAALLPVADLARRGVLVRTPLDPTLFGFLPLAATPANLAGLAHELMGQPYGWGGTLGNRDCSAMLQDLFAPFGLWLPRNSSAQARAGVVVSLKGLPAGDKERTILGSGVPFLSLIHLPGHIMLQIGQRDGRAVVLHDIWGVRTADPWNRTGVGRHIVGGVVITTLSPGIELLEVKLPEGNILERVDSLTILDRTANGKAE